MNLTTLSTLLNQLLVLLGLVVQAETIAKVAYDKWEQDGSQYGNSDQYWSAAENELRSKVRGRWVYGTIVAVALVLLVAGLFAQKETLPPGGLPPPAAVSNGNLNLGKPETHLVDAAVRYWPDLSTIVASGHHCRVQSDRIIVRCDEFDMTLVKPLP